MRCRLPRGSKLLAALAALALAPLSAQAQEQPAPPAEVAGKPDLLLMGTVPIYWGEVDGIGELLDNAPHAHWARALLERHFTLQPVDYLTPEVLAGKSYLLMAQPRALAPEENVALDDWVRDGGLLLLFADPMMTGESRFPIGDRRRPQDVALLSPILAHWGLELRFDDRAMPALVEIDHFGEPLPVNLPGELAEVPGGEASCNIPLDEGVLAHCVIGVGQAMVVADAAMLDAAGPYPHAEEAVERLVSHIFGPFGDFAGSESQMPSQPSENTANSVHSGMNMDHHGGP